jgi:hypothetical protein
MRRLLFISLLLGITLGGFAQTIVEDPNVEKREVGAFRGIHVATGIRLVLTKSDQPAVAVSAASAEFRDHIETKVKDGVLHIEYDNKLNAPNDKNVKKELKAWVSYTELEELRIHTGAEVRMEGILLAEKLKFEAHTGGAFEGEIAIEKMTVRQATGSQVRITGKVEKLEVEGHTGSMFHGKDLQAGECNATVNTGAGIFITVDNALYARAHTGGYVRYKGEAGTKDIRTHSGGRVRRI